MNDTESNNTGSADQELDVPDFTSPPPTDVYAQLRVVKHPIPFSMLDPDAVKVLRRLNRFGHEAYLVGGCVRDILLGIQPKDFDIATSAMPAEMRRLFRNCRLIGRRFRLAHLLFRNRKIIEVATFRRAPTEQDDVTERHAAENLFGLPADDAIRRDFTINALMYHVGRKEIVDWVGGLNDIENKLLRTIGDPNRRLPEDPVRIIRAIKFGVRLNLEFEDELFAAMKSHSALIETCAPARLVEEIFKLLRSGSSSRCLELLQEVDILARLMPELTKKLNATDVDDNRRWRTLAEADSMLRNGRAVSDSALLAALLYEGCKECINGEGDVAKKMDETLAPLVRPMVFTKRHMARVRQIFAAQRRLAGGPRTSRARKILDREYSAEAIDLFEMTATDEEERVIATRWREALSNRHKLNGPVRDRPGQRRRRRRPRRQRPPTTEKPE